MLTLSFEELLSYTNEERDRWRRFFIDHPDALASPVQPAAAETIGRLVDHIFLIERRHLQRLRGEPLTERTGLTGNNAAPLFDYGASVRRELEHYVGDLEDDEADHVRPIELRGRPWPMSARKLLFTILIHEVRHWAQIALAARLAGHEPPGDHDFFHTRALR